MAVKGAKSIAEYAIRKWLENEGFVMDHFEVHFTNPHEAEVSDKNGDFIYLIYDPNTKTVIAEDL